MIILDSSNGGYNGVTKDFWTTDLSGNEVVRRYFRALQGGYVIPINENATNMPNGAEITDENNFYIFNPNQTLFDTANPILGYYYGTRGDQVVNASSSSERPESPSITGSVYCISAMPGVQNLNETEEAMESNYKIAGAYWNYKGISFQVVLHNTFCDNGIVRAYNGSWYYAEAKFKIARERNIPIYSKIYTQTPSVFFYDNVKNLSLETIKKKFKFSKIIKAVKYAASNLVVTDNLACIKCFVFLIKEGSNVKTIIYEYDFIKHNLKQINFNFPIKDNLFRVSYFRGLESEAAGPIAHKDFNCNRAIIYIDKSLKK